MTPPSKKHLSTQQKDSQDALENVWIQGVLDRTSSPRAIPSRADPVDASGAHPHSHTDLQLNLHLLLRNVGSRVRKSVTEGYTTPPASLSPQTSPSKHIHPSSTLKGPSYHPITPLSPGKLPGPQDQIFASSKDILRSVYTGLRDANEIVLPTIDSSPKKRARTYSTSGLGSEYNEVVEEDQIEVDLTSTPTSLPTIPSRKIKPLPFRLPKTRGSFATRSADIADTSPRIRLTSEADDDDPFSTSTVSRGIADAEMDIDVLRDGVEVL